MIGIGVCVLIAVCALVLGIVGEFMVERMRQGAAYRTHGEILKQAEAEAANLRKAQELAGKEDLFKHRESMEANCKSPARNYGNSNASSIAATFF